jgi:hypothetical protein
VGTIGSGGSDNVGVLVYGKLTSLEVADDSLAYLQVVIGANLRVKQSFYISWRNLPGTGDGRTTVWIHPDLPLVFKYTKPGQRALDTAKLQDFIVQSRSADGLRLVVDPTGKATLEQSPGNTVNVF